MSAARDDWTDEDAVYFRLHTARFLKGVRGLGDAEFKVYTLLLIRMYEKEGPLVRNDELLATFCAMRPTTFSKALDKLIRIEKIEVLPDGTLINESARREIEWRNKRRRAGKAGGDASAAARKSSFAPPQELLRTSEETQPITEEKQVAAATIVPEPSNQIEEEEEEEEEKKKDVVVVAREAPSDPLYSRVLKALRLNEADILPARWMPPTAILDLDRIRDDLGLTHDEIVSLAEASFSRFGTAPNGPNALIPDAKRLASSKAAPRLEVPAAPAPRADAHRPHRTLTSEERLAAMRQGQQQKETAK